MDPFGPEAHDQNCSGRLGHYCAEWDGLYICENCPEFKWCLCEFVNEVTPECHGNEVLEDE